MTDNDLRKMVVRLERQIVDISSKVVVLTRETESLRAALRALVRAHRQVESEMERAARLLDEGEE